MSSNWAGNVTFRATQVARPSTVEEVQRLVVSSDRVRALGTGHSFSTVADSDGVQLSVAGLPPTMDIDSSTSTVRVSAGLRYGELAGHLDANGFALANLASLPHISVAGACATATHGSGVRHGNLATAVAGLELVTGDGTLVSLSRADSDLPGAVVGLGRLGIVTGLTLDLVPSFDICQYVYESLPLDADLNGVLAGAYSVSLFTDWTGPRINQVWVKRHADEPLTPVDATPADGPRHPVPGMPVANCTEQLGVPGPWYARLPHFRLEFTPSSGEELQSEFFVDRRDTVAAVGALAELGDRISPVLQISEIRTVAADELWLSPCHQRDSVAFHFTWVKDWPAVRPVLAAVEAALAPFSPRPHWAKLYTMDPRPSRLADFERLCARYDPTGRFRPPAVSPT